MTERPFFSVIISTHNRRDSLERTVHHLFNQTLSPDEYELIVVDDGSTDGTVNWLTGLAAQGRLRYLSQIRSGSAAARNAGARLARGQILAFTDDDCLPDPAWLDELKKAYAQADRPGAYLAGIGGAVRNASDGHWLQDFVAAQGFRHQENNSQWPRYLDTANATFNKSLFLAEGGFTQGVLPAASDDVDLGVRLRQAGYCLRSAPNALVWHVNPRSLPDLFRHAFLQGRRNALLMLKYPTLFNGSPGGRSQAAWRAALDRLVRRARQPFSITAAATLRRAAYDAAWLVFYAPRQVVSRWHYYKRLNLGTARHWLYFGLEQLEQVAVLAGQTTETFRCVHELAHTGLSLPESIAPTTEQGQQRNYMAWLYAAVESTNFMEPLTGIAGWLTPGERRALYALARVVPGPILEVGSWVGLSTACLAYGLRDSGRQDTFITIDINPTLANFRPVEGGIGFFLPEDETPRAITVQRTFRRQVVPIVSRPNGVTVALKENLFRLGLDHLVQPHIGDISQAPILPYQLIFCDVTHSQYEIECNAPALRRILQPGAILACHDTSAVLRTSLHANLPLSDGFQIDSLYVARVEN